MSFSAMYVNKEIEDLTPFKYLDSLDSVRFKDFETKQTNGAQLHAYADFFLSLLMGEGIVVPNNQLIDSLAFLDVASQLIQYAKKTNKLQFLTLRASLFNSDNPYEVASKQFGNIGTEEKIHEDRFVLSGWPYLDSDYPRRSKWKERLALGQPIPTTRDFTHPVEVPIVEQLNAVLEYFSTPDGKVNIKHARPNKQVRINEIYQIASLSVSQMEELLSDLDIKSSQILIDTISVVNKLTNNINDVDVRSNIVNALVLPGASDKLNPIYFEKTKYPTETHRGVLSIIDSIYNYASGYGVNADLIGHTAKANAQDMETPSFYALALWTRLTNKREKNFVLNTPNGLIVPSGIQWNKIIERRDIMEYIAKKKFPWDIIFEATTEPGWRMSLNSYLKALHDYHTSDPSNFKDAEKRYLDERLKHLGQSQESIPIQYYKIKQNEIQIAIDELRKQIEEEVVSTEEKGSEFSQTRGEEKGATASIEAKTGVEMGLLGPKVNAEMSGKGEVSLSMVNERQQMQSKVFRSETHTKRSQFVAFKLAEANKLYRIEAANATAIKGIIAEIEDSLV